MSPRHRHRLVVLVAAVAAVVLAEVGARVAARRLPPPADWELPAVEVLLSQMRNVPEGGVAFVGASQAGTDFVPTAFLARSRAFRSAFNAWLVGAGMRTVDRWTREFVVPELQPKVVVVGVTSRELNDNLPEDTFRKYRISRAVVAQVDGSPVLDRFRLRAERWSALIRLRDRLRTPVGLVRSLRDGRRAPTTEDPGIGELGVLADRVDQDFVAAPAHVERERGALSRYRVGGVQTAALRNLIAALQDGGVAVVLVSLPTFEPFTVAMHPRGAADVARYRAALRDISRDAGVPLLDGRDVGPFTRADFADPEHLNGRGASKLTRWVAAELDELVAEGRLQVTGRPTAGTGP